MPKCDICGEEFDTERGLHIHQSQKHDEEAEDVEEEAAAEEAEEAETAEEEEETVEEGSDTSTDDEVVKEIEEETAGGLLGGYSRQSVFTGGALVGVALGLIVGLFLSQGAGFNGASPADIEAKMTGLPGVDLNITSVTMENGVYEVNATQRTLTGQAQEVTVAHFSQDGQMIFLQGMKYDQFKDQLESAQQQQQPPTGSNSTANTTADSGNTTVNATQ